MTAPRPPAIDIDFYYNSASDNCPSTPRGRDAVPVGTVAARVMELHNLAKVSTCNASPSPVSPHTENSRVGFGRRVDSIFGKPASRSCKPDEDTQVDTKHTFLGLNTHRSNHMEEHAFVDGIVKWNRTAGPQQRLQISGSKEIIQHQATSSSDISSKGNSRREPPLAHKKETGEIKDSCPKIQSSHMNPSLSVPNPPHHIIPQVIINQEESSTASSRNLGQYRSIDQHVPTTTAESHSTGKMSDLRRQSLRDLYYCYGMQEPAGLIISQNITVDLGDTTRSLGRHEICNACSCTIASCAINDATGFSPCEKCQKLAPAGILTSDGSDECMENIPKCKGERLKKEKTIDQHPETKTTNCNGCEQPSSRVEWPPDRGELRQPDEKDGFHSTKGEPNSISRKLPIFCLEEATPCCKSLESPWRETQIPHTSQVYRQADPAEIFNSVKDATSFSNVDAIQSTNTPYTVGISTQLTELETHSLRHGHHHRQECHLVTGLCSKSPCRDDRTGDNDSCDGSGHDETEQGYLQCRHNITYARKRRRYLKETDSGYIAGASHYDEPEMLGQKIDQSPNHGNSIRGHHMTGKQCVSQDQNDCASSAVQTRLYEGEQSNPQTAYAEQITCLPNAANGADRISDGQQLLSLEVEQERPTNKTAEWTLDTSQSHDLHKRESRNQFEDEIADNSCESKWCRNEHHIQNCTAEIVHSTDHVYNEHTDTQQCVISRSTTPTLAKVRLEMMRPDPSSGLAASCLLTTVSGPKNHLKKKSHDCTTDDAIVPSYDTASQETPVSKGQSISRSQDRLREVVEESLAELPLSPSTNLNGVRSTNSDSFISAVIHETQDSSVPAPSTTVEADQPIQCVNPRTDPITDVAQSIPVRTPGDLSPSKSKPTSRRLSAFFKLQEQNVVSTLNKRLQDHQEALKQAEITSNDRVSERINAAIQSLSIDRNRDLELDAKEYGSQLESPIDNAAEKYNLDLSNPQPQLEHLRAKVESLGTQERDEGQNASSRLTHIVGGCQEHDCAWRQIVMKQKSRLVQNPNSCCGNGKTQGGDGVGDVGINGITIVIHLEGRENVIIKADLSQGI